ncbi:MAG: hypothetical protein AABX34_03290, partial [Nanoarchaeota archaeon]
MKNAKTAKNTALTGKNALFNEKIKTRENSFGIFCVPEIALQFPRIFSSTKKSAKLISGVPKIRRIFQDIKSISYFLYNKIILIFAVMLLCSISAFAANNVSILYGWNGTDNVAVRLDASGRLMTTINLTESIGLFPDADNLRDLGTASLRWRALYVFDIIAAGNINVGSINASGGLNVTAGNVLLAVSSGNVGIGTAAPDNKLTIRGTDADSYLDVPGILHLNVTDSQNTTLTNIITLDHLLNNPINATNPKAGV